MARFKKVSQEVLLEFQKKLAEILPTTIARQSLSKEMTPKKMAHLKRLSELNKARGLKLRRYRRNPVFFKGKTKQGKWLITNHRNLKELYDTPQEAQKRVDELNQWLPPGHPFRVQPNNSK